MCDGNTSFYRLWLFNRRAISFHYLYSKVEREAGSLPSHKPCTLLIATECTWYLYERKLTMTACVCVYPQKSRTNISCHELSSFSFPFHRLKKNRFYFRQCPHLMELFFVVCSSTQHTIQPQIRTYTQTISTVLYQTRLLIKAIQNQQNKSIPNQNIWRNGRL